MGSSGVTDFVKFYSIESWWLYEHRVEQHMRSNITLAVIRTSRHTCTELACLSIRTNAGWIFPDMPVNCVSVAATNWDQTVQRANWKTFKRGCILFLTDDHHGWHSSAFSKHSMQLAVLRRWEKRNID